MPTTATGPRCWIADYTFRDTGRKVRNDLRSKFAFKDGLIIHQRDDCDAWSWGMQALGPVKGALSWLFPGKRRERPWTSCKPSSSATRNISPATAALLPDRVAVPT